MTLSRPQRILCHCGRITTLPSRKTCYACGRILFETRALNDTLSPEDLKRRVVELEDFIREIRDGYDCDTGANGVHAYRCRCCVAGDLLGEPPSTFDPRTRGG